jgi:hypothetical protein
MSGELEWNWNILPYFQSFHLTPSHLNTIQDPGYAQLEIPWNCRGGNLQEEDGKITHSLTFLHNVSTIIASCETANPLPISTYPLLARA